MTQPAPKRSPDPPPGAAAAGPVLVAADHSQGLVWIRFDGPEKFAIAFEPAEARELAGALVRAADELDTARRVNSGLSVC